jgi:hypothetical protein
MEVMCTGDAVANRRGDGRQHQGVDLLQVRTRQLLDGLGGLVDARVVDEGVDVSGLLADAVRGGLHGRVVGDVEE